LQISYHFIFFFAWYFHVFSLRAVQMNWMLQRNFIFYLFVVVWRLLIRILAFLFYFFWYLSVPLGVVKIFIILYQISIFFTFRKEILQFQILNIIFDIKLILSITISLLQINWFLFCWFPLKNFLNTFFIYLRINSLF